MPSFDVTHLLRALVLAWFGVVGACVGSFLNVVVYRLPAGLNLLRPGSRCPFCAVGIAPRDNVPILSWFILRGRCRHCHLPIASRYPWVEFGVAVLFVLLSAVWLPPRSFYYRVDDTILGQWMALFSCLVLMCTWIAAAGIENDAQPVPRRLVIPLGLIAVVHAVCLTGPWECARGSLSSLLGGVSVALLAARITAPSALVPGTLWAGLLVATGSLFGINGFVVIWFLAACSRLVAASCRPAIRSAEVDPDPADAEGIARRSTPNRECFQRLTGGLAGWTMATLVWSMACGVASSGTCELGYFTRVASLLATIHWAWVLAFGGGAVLLSLLTGCVRPRQSQA